MQRKEILPVVGSGMVVQAVLGPAMESWWMVFLCDFKLGKTR